MNKDSKIYVAGHTGLVGSAIMKELQEKDYENLVTRNHSELDLTRCDDVESFFQMEKPEYVFLAAAKVGGIVANDRYRADFFYQNLMIQTNVIQESYLNDVKKLMFLGSTCVYPKNCKQPIKEDFLLTGPLEYTNESYAVTKIAGMRMCESYNLQYGTNFISVMPTNLYGPNDNFNLETSHVLPALLRKLLLGKALMDNNWSMIEDDLNKRPIEKINGGHKRREILEILGKYGIKQKENNETTVEIWGSGKPLREFLWSADMANACVYLMENINFEDIIKGIEGEIRNTQINIGTGKEISIEELAYLIKNVVKFEGALYFNDSKADGTMRKLTDTSKINSFGWSPKKNLKIGIKNLCTEYCRSLSSVAI